MDKIKYPTSDRLTDGVKLDRWTEGDAWELGSREQWAELIANLDREAPTPVLVDNLHLEIFHMSHPELDRRRKAGLPTLEDYNLTVDGFQFAVGLNQDLSWIAIGLYSDNHSATDNTWKPIPYAQVERAFVVLGHELGHRYDHFVGAQKSDSKGQALTAAFNAIRPHQGHNFNEDWAECYLRFFGANGGKYSDKSSGYIKPEVRVLLTLASDFRAKASGSISDLKVTSYTSYGLCLQWKETHWLFWTQYKMICLDNRRLYTWINGAWQ